MDGQRHAPAALPPGNETLTIVQEADENDFRYHIINQLTNLFFFMVRQPSWAKVSSLGFQGHTIRHNTLGKTPLDE